MLDDLIINLGISGILTALKNDPGKTQQLRKALLKVYRAIEEAFQDDPDFRPKEPATEWNPSQVS